MEKFDLHLNYEATVYDVTPAKVTEWTKKITFAIAKSFFIDFYREFIKTDVPAGWPFSYVKWKELMENEM